MDIHKETLISDTKDILCILLGTENVPIHLLNSALGLAFQDFWHDNIHLESLVLLRYHHNPPNQEVDESQPSTKIASAKKA